MECLILKTIQSEVITSPSRQRPLDHRHYPRSRRAMAPTIVRRMGSS